MQYDNDELCCWLGFEDWRTTGAVMFTKSLACFDDGVTRSVYLRKEVEEWYEARKEQIEDERYTALCQSRCKCAHTEEGERGMIASLAAMGLSEQAEEDARGWLGLED